MNPMFDHRPVMMQEAILGLWPRPDGVWVDGTYGRGGHASALLAALDETACVWLVDQDPQAIELARSRHGDDPRCRILQARFSDIGPVLRGEGMTGQVMGLLLDLGVSSPQLDDPVRGFSFLRDGPLDMRMDNTRGETAREWLARVDEKTLTRVLREYGEERFARRIARGIGAAREADALPETTTGLASLIAEVVPHSEPGRHPATRSFQAIRIHVNDELEALDAVLSDTCELLGPGGRLVVISFHSLEDRRVKRFINRHSQVGALPAGAGRIPPEKQPKLRRVGRACRPTESEVRANPRARSAILRVAERLP